MPKDQDLGNNYYPSGWQPKYEFEESVGVGEITHVGTDKNYKDNFDKILQQWGFDPELYEIDGGHFGALYPGSHLFFEAIEKQVSFIKSHI